MPKSKKPKKPYRPKYVPGQLPLVFRQSSKADLMLQMIPHEDLETLRVGHADKHVINTLAFRLNWGYVMSNEIFDNEEVRRDMEVALGAISSVRERFDRIGKYGVSGEEFKAIGQALSWTDEMQQNSTRRDQQKCLNALYLINKHIEENTCPTEN